MFSQRPGMVVICAESGNEGLRKLRAASDQFDVVLLDQLMPGMSGMEVLARIKIWPRSLPVIIMTGSVTEETSARSSERAPAIACQNHSTRNNSATPSKSSHSEE